MQRYLPHIRPATALRSIAVTSTVLAVLCVSLAVADSKPRERARYGGTVESDSYVRFTPFNLENGSKLTLISPARWSDLAEELVHSLRKTHAEYTEILGPIPAFSSSIRLMDEEAFYELTGAPTWTNAMFFRGEIIIPLSKTKPIDIENLDRSVRHEFTHAVLSAMSGGQIPGWLDEGIAQWSEGHEHPALRHALRSWLKAKGPVPLSLLQGGFTKLDASMVPAAYAESLLASKAIIRAFGFRRISAYLALLRRGDEKDSAFEAAFALSPKSFEEKLGQSLHTWADLPEPKASALQGLQ